MSNDSMSSEGYRCEFIDSVPDVCFCKKCSLVARKLTVTSCCTMSFCYSCISSVYNQGKPCPTCGESKFSRYTHRKFQRWINNYKIFCTLKDRGCQWSGKLEQLEAHLNPDVGNCQYMDIRCPLNCPMTIPKNKVEHHVSKECVRRDFTCQHCNFKATYEEVVGKHLKECVGVPKECPYSCGVMMKLDKMEDHLKSCPMGATKCQFSVVGCDKKVPRQGQEEHSRQNILNHVQLTAAATVSGCQQLYNITCDQGKKQSELDKRQTKLEERLYRKIHQMDKKISTLEHQQGVYEQEKERMLKQIYQLQLKLEGEKDTATKVDLYKECFQEMEEQLREDLRCKQERKLKEMEEKLLKLTENQQQREFQVMEEKLKKHADQQKPQMVEKQLSFKLLGLNLFGTKQVEKSTVLSHSFVIEHFELQLGTCSWKSPTMYTHERGYRFVVDINLSKYFFQSNEGGLDMEFNHMHGEHDAQLKWPVRVDFNYELCNDAGRKLHSSKYSATWEKNVRTSTVQYAIYCSQHAVPLYKILPYVHGGNLHFNITNIIIH